jgi:pyridoxamine 5'-phosphate oxidase
MAANLNMFTINQPHIPDFTNPLQLLVHCHERIEAQLNALERAGDLLLAQNTQSLPSVFAAIDMACGHFAMAGVKHTEDEDVSLFPRLREYGGNAGQEALAEITELESQHRTAEKSHAELDQIVARLPRDGSAEQKMVERFGAVVSELTALYRPHILLENNFIFPVAARVLPADQIQALGQEMRERRKDILRRFEVAR